MSRRGDPQGTIEESMLPSAASRLIQAVQTLSSARSLDDVRAIVSRAAREITGADGATFVLREGDQCFYAEEDAIEPLWRGRKFPLEDCISGWSMVHHQSVVIEDIYQDDRVPHEAYRPTFVQSLAVVPIRKSNPIGAIGTYWAMHHRATDLEIELLQALADSTSVAIENVRINSEIEALVRERTADLEMTNAEVLRLSFTDDLTGLLNRRGFWEMAKVEWAQAVERQAHCTVLFIDLDNLKTVNDRFGHDAGDEILRTTATTLRTALRSTDLLARMGGDEFVALVTDNGDNGARVMARVSAAMAKVNESRDPELVLQLSMGTQSCVAGEIEGLDRLIAQADTAMYVAKRRSRQSHRPTEHGDPPSP